MAKIELFRCDCCHKEFRDETAKGSTEIRVPGLGPVDRPEGKELHRKWSDVCPPCIVQLRDAVAKFIEARKGGLDTNLNDSTRSPTTQQIEKAEAKGKHEERERTLKVVDDMIAGTETVIHAQKKSGDDPERHETYLTAFQSIRTSLTT